MNGFEHLSFHTCPLKMLTDRSACTLVCVRLLRSCQSDRTADRTPVIDDVRHVLNGRVTDDLDNPECQVVVLAAVEGGAEPTDHPQDVRSIDGEMGHVVD